MDTSISGKKDKFSIGRKQYVLCLQWKKYGYKFYKCECSPVYYSGQSLFCGGDEWYSEMHTRLLIVFVFYSGFCNFVHIIHLLDFIWHFALAASYFAS